ncbi:MAG: PDZ domain-containing protein [Phycisphaerales bacterium]|nr:MAG: PDZ domain-containing protein [Phycisphaerales bacterium]
MGHTAQQAKTLWALTLTLLVAMAANAAEFYVAPTGSDSDLGTLDRPFATIARAQKAARAARKAAAEPVTVYLRTGTYYLPRTLVFTSEDSGAMDAPVVYTTPKTEKAVISGGMKLELQWKPWKNGIMQANVPPGTKTDQLFANGQRLHMARHPNFDPRQRIFNGYDKDCFSPGRAARWADPKGGFIHAMHRNMWGDFHYLITGKDQKGNITYVGGWQNNRRNGMHNQFRFVENIFEELDCPGEWFLDNKANRLYLYPPEGLDLKTAIIEGVRLTHLVEFNGSPRQPVRFITIKGLTFRHAARTFMDNKEPLLRSDWTIYRGGAVLFSGAEDCTLEDCFLDQLGGNAVFLSMFNRRVAIRACHIARAGGNGVAFVGDPNAVRSPLFECSSTQKLKDIDRTPGPKTDNYPVNCVVEDCLIYLTGRVEKQTAPVQIAMSRAITVRHCSIYDVPRAGINIGDGCWGGHLIEFCDVFDTVKETGDHGSFNSWGRDRYWGLEDVDLNTVTLGELKDLPLLDTVDPIIIRNNRWRCDHGWDIDLDDGSSNYQISNNLCLNGGIKLREGFHRTCQNNIMVNNSFHPHVWYENSRDIFRRNIVFTDYRPIRAPAPWGTECDFNLLHKPGPAEPAPAARLQQQSGLDANSITADALFVNPAQGDYRVDQNSPALKLGFNNFPIDRFGVRKPQLKILARTPRFPKVDAKPAASRAPGRGNTLHDWLGAKIKDVAGIGEVSASGLPGEVGVLVAKLPNDSNAAKIGIRQGDVILRLGNTRTDSADTFLSAYAALKPGRQIALTVYRDQKPRTINLATPSQ